MAVLTHGLETTPTGATTWREILNNNMTALDPNRVFTGLLSAIPSAGTTGRFYFATDVDGLFWDTGTKWIPVANSRVRTIAGADTATYADRFVLGNATGGALAPVLPAASAAAGQLLTYQKIDASGNAVTVTRAGSDTIDGATTVALAAQWDRVTLFSDGGSAWHRQ